MSGGLDAAVLGTVVGLRMYVQHRRAADREPGASVSGNALVVAAIAKNTLLVIAAGVLWSGVPRGGPFWLGWMVVAAALVLRLVALRQLGGMYSRGVEIRARHALVTSGVYGVVRHPLYLAHLLEASGVAVLAQAPPLAALLVPLAAAWAVRIGTEETALAQALGPAWRTYAQRVPALDPVRGLLRKARTSRARHG